MPDYFNNSQTSIIEFKVNQILTESAFSPAECKQIINFCRKLSRNDALGTPELAAPQAVNIKAKYIEISAESSWIAQRIMEIAEQANEMFFHYNLHTLAELQFHEYAEGSGYGWHMDSSGKPALARRKISINVLLSEPDDYEGGKLEYMPAIKRAMPAEPGTVILSHAFKVYRVAPLIKGNRYSLTAWVHGD